MNAADTKNIFKSKTRKEAQHILQVGNTTHDIGFYNCNLAYVQQKAA